MPIKLNNKEIKRRNNEIRNLIKPLSKNGKDVSCKISGTPTIPNSIIFGAFGGPSPSSSDHHNWYFKTHKKDYNASYFEIWSANERVFILQKAYFKLMVNQNNVNKEILSLHIDPTEEDNLYKAGPHIHVKTSYDIISKAHISLSLNNLTDVIHSFKEFNRAYKDALTMINNEILITPSW